MTDVLGNAHLTNFFVNNESMEQLNLALKAYTQTVLLILNYFFKTNSNKILMEGKIPKLSG